MEKKWKKYYYLAIQVYYRGKHYAFVKRVSETDNLITKLKNQTYASATICRSGKHAKELVELWNEGFKERGEYRDPTTVNVKEKVPYRL